MLHSQNGRTNFNRLRLRTALPLILIMALSACCIAFMRQDGEQGLTSCQSNLKQYALGLLMYVQDYDEYLPPMKFPSQLQPRVDPYIKNSAIYSCPVTGQAYLPNPALNYVFLGDVKAPASMLLLRDAKPHTTDLSQPTWNVALLDGHVKPVTTEPMLGKPAPTPPPLTHAQQVRSELKMLHQQRREIDARIRQLEKEQRRLQRRQ